MIIAVKSINEMSDMFADVKPMDFSDMGLMEASHYCQDMLTEAWDDLKFSIMAEEYKYLYENGIEMLYEEEQQENPGTALAVQQKGEISNPEYAKNKASVLEKIKALISKFVSMIGGLINKAITNIRAHAISAGSKVSGRSMMSKKEFDSTALGMDKGTWNNALAGLKTGFKVDPFTISNQTKGFIIEFPDSTLDAKWESNSSAESMTKEIVEPFSADKHGYMFTPQKVSDCVYNGFKAIGKNILKVKKEVDAKAKAAIKAAEKAQVSKLGNIMDAYKVATKHNTAVVSAMLNIWNIYARECRVVVNFVANHNKVKSAASKNGEEAGKAAAEKSAKKTADYANKMAEKNDKSISGKKLFKEKKARAAAENDNK